MKNTITRGSYVGSRKHKLYGIVTTDPDENKDILVKDLTQGITAIINVKQCKKIGFKECLTRAGIRDCENEIGYLDKHLCDLKQQLSEIMENK